MTSKIKLVLAGLIFSINSHATPLIPEQVPEPLKPWVGWVLEDQPELGCPFIYNNYEQKRCSWPARLDLDFHAGKGSFVLSGSVYKESWIGLPGNARHWPQNVSASNKTVAVVEKDGSPAVKLLPGDYQIKGEFYWKTIPDSLTIPADSGLIRLQVNNIPVDIPAIRGGQLWLSENDTGRKKPDNIQNTLDVQVFRKISDSVPMQIVTRLILNVSGEQRQVKLAKPLLDGFIPLSLTSPLPARLEPDGQLLVQVRPGEWQLDITSRSANEINTLPLSNNSKEWPETEIWAFEARPDLRIVEIEQLLPIDASQTNAPEEWRHLPHYSLNQGRSLALKVIRRGDPEPEPNQLTLHRKLWLDFDGEGYTVNDKISGKMSKDWRLDVRPEMQLGKATLNGNNQLITFNETTGRQGVEVRQGAVGLDADSRRLGNTGELSAAGWEQSFNQVNAELNLPPGWRLLAVSGVDNLPDSWVFRWTLLDLFLVLIAALATSRLFGRNWGIFTLLTLALIWHESGAPQYIWLNILAVLALIRVLPSGRFLRAATWYRNISWLLLIISLVPFMADQVRTGIYPQLEYPWREAVPSYEQPQSGLAEGDTTPAAAPAALPAQDMAEPMIAPEESKAYSRGNSYDKPDAIYGKLKRAESGDSFNRYDPDAKVQTGPGLPQWQWRRVQLAWNGSVDANQQLRLWYLPPKVVMLLNFLRVILVCGLALLMFGLQNKLKLKANNLIQALVLFLVLPLINLPGQKAYADIPTKEVLEELKTRLLKAPDCLTNCAQIPSLAVVIGEKELEINLQVHAQQEVNIPLPAFYGQWFPNQVELDGKTAQGLYRNGNELWVNIPAGQHAVVMRGLSPLLPSFTLPLALKPNRITSETGGWQISGVQDDGQIESQLQFTRISESKQSAENNRLSPGALPPYVRVQRTVQLGLDWRVSTSVERLSPPDAAIVLQIPLLKGEKVTTPGIAVKDQKVEVNLPAQQNIFSWESNLDKTGTIELTAGINSGWQEVWKADVSPIWHIETEGIPMIRLNHQGQWLPEWHPWPGESMSLKITRPKPVEGQTLTIDSSRLSIRPGKRTRDADLKISLRSSQGAQHTITLPENAVLQSLTINGQISPVRQEKNRLTIPVNPGSQEIAMTWQEPAGISLITETPAVDLGQASINTRLGIGLGQDRWVLFTWGPRLGPAVLFWGVVIVILILSYGLARIPLTPLKFRQWFLLLLGLSQLPLEAAGLVAAWLLLLGWRVQKPIGHYRYFNLFQLLLGVLTFISLAILITAVEQGLLGGSPNMQIIGNQSTAFDLNWYQDRSAATLPKAMAVSIPVWMYRIAMLLWSFWLAASLLNWLKWGWQSYSLGGFWHKKPSEIITLNMSKEENK